MIDIAWPEPHHCSESPNFGNVSEEYSPDFPKFERRTDRDTPVDRLSPSVPSD